MTSNVTLNELGEFLKKRHSELSPRTVGLPETGGPRRVHWDTLTANTDPDQHLTVWTAAPGIPTHERLRSLASWATEQNLSASFVPPLTGDALTPTVAPTGCPARSVAP
ncbi:hypothetical protein [Streptomyces coeruleorubidus]